jgi:hypothetical protein
MPNVFAPDNIQSPKHPVENKEPVQRIYRTDIKPTIQLDELSLPGQKSTGVQKIEDVISVEFPLVKINDYIFNRDELINVTIDCTDFLPKISLIIFNIDHVFLSREMPKDGDIVSIAVRNKSDLLKIIRNDYVITGVIVERNITQRKAPAKMTVYGELFIPGLKSQTNDFSFKGTSLEALKDFAQRYGLGFSSNESNTNDKQIWLKANIAGDIYINNVISRAWKDEKSFYTGWIDVYYNLNFIDLNKQLASSETEVDIASISYNLDKGWLYGVDTKQEKTAPMIKVFTNYIDFIHTSFYIVSWRPINRSTSITFQMGTKMTCEMFEHNKNVYENSQAKKYWMIPVEPTYSEDKLNKSILLRGRANFDASINTTDLQRANYPYLDLYGKFPWLGVQYTISNPDDDNLQWDGNHHKNYQRAAVQNLINNKELDKINLHIDVKGNNFNIIRGDKMPVVIVKTDAIENQRINPQSKFNDITDLFYSGWYIIKGFILSWNGVNEKSIQSNYEEEFILTRREWPAPVPIQPISTTPAPIKT